VYTCARHEKSAYTQLLRKGIESLLPVQKQFRQWSDRKKWIEVPLFPSYVFVKPMPDQIESVLRTPGVVRYVTFNNRKAVVRSEEINFLLKCQSADISVEVTANSFDHEERVIITSGIFAGYSGRLLRRYEDRRVAIRIEEIGYSVIIRVGKEKISIDDIAA